MSFGQETSCQVLLTSKLQNIASDLGKIYDPPVPEQRIRGIIRYAVIGTVLIGRCPKCNDKRTNAYCDSENYVYILCTECAEDEDNADLFCLSPLEQRLVRLIAHVRAGGYSFPCFTKEERAVRELLNLQSYLDKCEQ
jgi:hypothetical protein